MVLEDSGFKTFLGDKREPGETMRVVEEKQDENTAHVKYNFLDCVRSRQPKQLVADIQEVGSLPICAHGQYQLSHWQKASVRAGHEHPVYWRWRCKSIAHEAAVPGSYYGELVCNFNGGREDVARADSACVMCVARLAGYTRSCNSCPSGGKLTLFKYLFTRRNLTT